VAEPVAVSFSVNGRPVRLSVASDRRLLDVLRDELRLTGAKEGCGKGECGACTVIVDGRSVNSCLMLAAEADGSEILTVEGLAAEGRLSPLQKAFLDHGAAQCGFCIPGQLMSAHALLMHNPHPTPEEIREALAGNLCRCAGYEQITEAVLAAAEEVGR